MEHIPLAPSGAAPANSVSGGTAPGVHGLPIPTGFAHTEVDTGCGCCVCVGPDCQPKTFTVPRECLPSLTFDQCDEVAVVIGNGKGGTTRGTIYKEVANLDFDEDTDADCEGLENVPVWFVDGVAYARTTDNRIFKRNTNGTWSLVDCGPVAEDDCFKCIVVDLSTPNVAVFYDHIAPTIDDIRENITASL